MKINELQGFLRAKKVGLALFFSSEAVDPAITYFTGLENAQHCVLLIPASGSPRLLANVLEAERAKKGSRIPVVVLKCKLSDYLSTRFPSLKHIGLHEEYLSLTQHRRLVKTFSKASFIDLTAEVTRLRLTKTSEEIGHLCQAAAIADRAFTRTLKNFNYRTEAELGAALDYHIKKQGSKNSFPTIVASGRNASQPHHITSTARLQRGFCVIDFGAVYQNYCSDMTRTIFIGTPTQQKKDLYLLLLRSQQQGVAASTIGVSCADVDKASRSALGKHAKYFIHSLGHGIGVEVHEAPHLGLRSTEKLQSGMVFTIEPGIYLPGKLGIRIEDMVALGKKKEILTKTTKELLVFPSS